MPHYSTSGFAREWCVKCIIPHYLGIGHIPYTEGYAVFYRIGEVTFASIIRDGCVIKGVVPVGPYRAEERV